MSVAPRVSEVLNSTGERDFYINDGDIDVTCDGCGAAAPLSEALMVTGEDLLVYQCACGAELVRVTVGANREVFIRNSVELEVNVWGPNHPRPARPTDRD